MYQHLLVPLDGSELAERALPCAERLARATGATVHLVRVVEPLPSATTWAPVPLEVPPSLHQEFLTKETNAATAYLDTMRERLAATGVQVQATHMLGSAASALLDYQREAHIDLVVMCSHGRSGLARFAMGSVADRLLHHGIAPLLLVRAFGPPLNPAHAVVPLDGSVRAEEALGVVDQLARYVVREVTLLRVIDAPEQGPEAEHYLSAVSQRLLQEHLACFRQVEQGDPATRIVEAAGTDKLVVMATHGRSGVTRWALGSVADRVAHGGAAGVLLVRAGTTVAPSTH